MCTYCMCGDWVWKYDRPWNPPVPIPYIPLPVGTIPQNPWQIDKLLEFEDLLRRVKELEDKLGCPCEPNKADHLSLLRDRIKELESKAVSGYDIDLTAPGNNP